MNQSILTILTTAGVVKQRRRAGATTLCVTPRFLDHAETTALRSAAARVNRTSRPRRPTRQPTDAATGTLAAALDDWPAFRGDALRGAAVLRDLLGRRDQLGQVAPLFPPLAAFAAP